MDLTLNAKVYLGDSKIDGLDFYLVEMNTLESTYYSLVALYELNGELISRH